MSDGARGFGEPLYLVRHAKAGSRDRWTGDDRLRPLSAKGRRQAEGLVAALSQAGICAILSSPSDRCRQTVEPLAAVLDLPVETRPWLQEGTAIRSALDGLAGTPGPAVLSSHGDVVAGAVLALVDSGVAVDGPLAWKKGSTWVIERVDGAPTLLRYVPPPHDGALPVS